MAGIITVIACAGNFELLERRKRALPAGGRKNTAGRPAWVAATCPMPPFYLVQPVQEGVHSLPPGANPGAYRQRPNIHPPKKGLRYERRKENWLFRRTGKQPC